MKTLELIASLAVVSYTNTGDVIAIDASGKEFSIDNIEYIPAAMGVNEKTIIHIDGNDGVQQLRDAAEELLDMLDEAKEAGLILGRGDMIDKANQMRELLK